MLDVCTTLLPILYPIKLTDSNYKYARLENNVDPDKPDNLDLHCFQNKM